MSANAEPKTATKLADLNEHARQEIDYDRRRHEQALSSWRDQVATENSSPTYLIRVFAEGLFHSEEMLRWHKGLAYCLGDEGDGLEDLLGELESRLDSWTPMNSTCLLERLRGDVELRTLREARDLVRRVLKINERSAS